jgi:mono/diheme cytochrome c family protein
LTVPTDVFNLSGHFIQELFVNRITRLVSSIAFSLCALLFTNPIAFGQEAALPTPAQEAQETFQARCSTCHAEHGEGSEVGASLNVPDLRSEKVQKNDDAFLRLFIKNGKGNMPAFNRDFSDQQIDRIVQLVRSFAIQSKQQAQARSNTN